MPYFADRVAETSVTPGVANLSLAGAKPGCRTFGAGVGYGTVTYYMVVHQTSGQWERGIGTVAAGPDVLTRTTVLDGTAGPAVKVNFNAGTLDVFIDLPASKAVAIDPVTGKVNVPAGLVVVGTAELEAVTATTILASALATLAAGLKFGKSTYSVPIAGGATATVLDIATVLPANGVAYVSFLCSNGVGAGVVVIGRTGGSYSAAILFQAVAAYVTCGVSGSNLQLTNGTGGTGTFTGGVLPVT